jgi:maleate cis-trans isomerase
MYDRNDDITRLGIIYPTGGGEYEYYKFAEALDYRVRPMVVCAQSYGEDFGHDPAALRRTGSLESLERTAKSLLPLDPDSAIWACTSGSFIDGRAFAEAQVEMIARVVGCPASSTSLAFIHALEALGIDRVAVLGSYIEVTTRAFTVFLDEFGIGIERFKALGAPGGQDAFDFSREMMLAGARGVDTSGAGAILIPDTAMATMHLIEPLEKELGKPILTANQVTLWDSLRIAGAGRPMPEYGRLFAAG